MASFLISFILTMTISAFAKEPKTHKKLISTSVGKVMDHIVTSREVHMGYLIEKVLFRAGKRHRQKKKSKFLAIKSKGFSQEVTSLLLEWVVYLEAKDFSSTQIKPKEFEKARLNLLKGLSSMPHWKSLAFTQKEINESLSRKLQAKKFIRFKVESSVVPITDSEAHTYFNNNHLKFGNLPFENFKPNIKAYLSRQQVDRRLKDWFEVLQAKYKVRNYLTEF